MMGKVGKYHYLFFLLRLSTLFLLSACTNVAQPTPVNHAPTLLSSIENQIPCAAENWNIAITSVDQINLGDSTKLVFAGIGVENNDSLWGHINSLEYETQKHILLTTEDGSVYEYLENSFSVPSEQKTFLYQELYEPTGHIETPLLPPGFAALGVSIDGEPHYYNFAFQIPETKIPYAVSIDGMQATCILTYVIGENGQPIYREKTIQLPAQIYNLDTDIAEVHDTPSARRYPNLTGTEWITPDWKESIFITDVTQSRNEIIVTYDFTNFSSHAAAPSFNGYIIGSNRLFICQNDCKSQPSNELVQPGQTAQDLILIFTIPEGETNLIFVYAYGGRVDLNDARRINLE
jgi:hypothetical protein